MSRPTIAFTSGCFDHLHSGHLHFLRESHRVTGADQVWIGLNVDEHIRRTKRREPQGIMTRMDNLLKTGLVDEVYPVSLEGPLELILAIRPDFIVVGDDYTVDRVVGAKECEKWGGRVVIIPRLPGISTTEILKEKARI